MPTNKQYQKRRAAGLCGTCGKVKTETTRCRACQELARKCRKESRRNIRVIIAEIKTRYGCQNPRCPCPIDAPAYTLEFHHVAADKAFTIGSLETDCMATVMKEIGKCTVLCTYCHRLEQHGGLDVSSFPRCDVNPDGSINSRFA